MKEDAYLEWESHIVWDKRNHKRDIYKQSLFDYVDYFFNRIKSKKNFTHFRICDGEYRAMFLHKTHRDSMTPDEISHYNEKLYELINFKLNSKYPINDLIIHLQQGSPYCKQFDPQIAELNPQKLMEIPDSDAPSLQNVCASGVFGFISVADTLMEDFIKLISESDYYVILVGPEYLNKIPDLRVDSHIKSVLRGSWRFQEKLESETRASVEYALLSGKVPLIMYAASIGGKITLLNLYKQYRHLITQIDCGAAFDGIVNVYSRPWHPKLISHYKEVGTIPKDEDTVSYNVVGERATHVVKPLAIPPTKVKEKHRHVQMKASDKMPIGALDPAPFPYEFTEDTTYAHMSPWLFNFNYIKDESNDVVLRNILTGTESGILEVGEWDGFVTQKINSISKNAHIFIVNPIFSTDVTQHSFYKNKTENQINKTYSALKTLKNTFIKNTWSIKNNISVYEYDLQTNVDMVAKTNRSIDAVYIHNNFNSDEDCYSQLEFIFEKYPFAKIIGNGYIDESSSNRIQRALKHIEKKFKIKIKNKRDVWYIN
jgi:hypothetical protein